ncbi:MAG: ferritin [Candidatus Delongbacteria bacterium]|nr:ferritin [Candidatus Delongbacteria bacterium]MBN2834253.1 ferritin [Candidatus Delongbacteria bacterium]
MLKKNVAEALNNQVQVEAFSSNLYLAMASWCEVNGFEGAASFLYAHSEEERMHQMKLFSYINRAGGHAIVPELEKPESDYENLKSMFEKILEHEIFVTDTINKLVDICISEKDYLTNNFLQWYINEQLEEEDTFKKILDKINMIGIDGRGLYFLDNELKNLSLSNSTEVTA